MTTITASRGDSCTIGALARAADVKIETIRYYEHIGLMPEPPRTQGRHRTYKHGDIERLRFIRRARELGFSIGDIRALLTLAAQEPPSCADARAIAAARLADVRARRDDLARLEKILAQTIERCDARCCSDPAPLCPVLEVLES